MIQNKASIQSLSSKLEYIYLFFFLLLLFLNQVFIFISIKNNLPNYNFECNQCSFPIFNILVFLYASHFSLTLTFGEKKQRKKKLGQLFRVYSFYYYFALNLNLIFFLQKVLFSKIIKKIKYKNYANDHEPSKI